MTRSLVPWDIERWGLQRAGFAVNSIRTGSGLLNTRHAATEESSLDSAPFRQVVTPT